MMYRMWPLMCMACFVSPLFAAQKDGVNLDRVALTETATSHIADEGVDTRGQTLELRKELGDAAFVQGTLIHTSGTAYTNYAEREKADYDYNETRLGAGWSWVDAARFNLFTALGGYERDQPEFDSFHIPGDFYPGYSIDEYRGNRRLEGVYAELGMVKLIRRSVRFSAGALFYRGDLGEDHWYAKWSWGVVVPLALDLGISYSKDAAYLVQLGFSAAF